jgi:hypothetical protein
MNFTDTTQWTNGVPSTTVAGIMNETCSNCYVYVYGSVTVGQLRLTAATADGITLVLMSGATLTVTQSFVLGTNCSNTNNVGGYCYGSTIQFQGGTLNVMANANFTAYYDSAINTYSGSTGTINMNGTFIARAGNISCGTGGGSCYTIDVQGVGFPGVELTINSFGTWNSPDSNVILRLLYTTLNFYSPSSVYAVATGQTSGGSLNYNYPSWMTMDSNVNFQPGFIGAPTGPGGWHFEASTNLDEYYVNAADIAIINLMGPTQINSAQYVGVNIIHKFNTSHMNCLFDGYAVINTTVNTLGNLGVQLQGTTMWGDMALCNSGGGSITTGFAFGVFNAYGSTIQWPDDGYFLMINSVTFVNNGTLLYNGDVEMYIDTQSTFINAGCFNLNSGYTLNVYPSDITGNPPQSLSTSPTTPTGYFINLGTMSVTGTYSLSIGQGGPTFFQCATGQMISFYSPNNIPYPFQFNAIGGLDGLFISAYVNGSNYGNVKINCNIGSDCLNLFNWVGTYYSTGNMMWNGSLSVVSVPPQGVLNTCWEQSGSGYSTDTVCSTLFSDASASPLPVPLLTGGVCGVFLSVPGFQSIMATFPLGTNQTCGNPLNGSAGSGPTPGPSTTSGSTTSGSATTGVSTTKTTTSSTPSGTSSTPSGTSSTPSGTSSTPSGTSSTPSGTTSTNPSTTSSSTLSCMVVLLLVCLFFLN